VRDERGLREDEVEALAPHRREEIALEEVRRETVQGGVEPGQRDGARVHVHADGAPRTPLRGRERQGSTATADVERRTLETLRHELRQHGRPCAGPDRGLWAVPEAIR